MERKAQKELERGTHTVVPLSAEVTQDAHDAGIAPEIIEPQVIQGRSLNDRRSGERRTQLLMQASSFSGPLPPPDLLRGYDEVVPGCADRIITQFEEQGRHRRKQESRVISHRLFSSTFGQILAFLLLLSIIGAGTFLAYSGKEVAGFGTIATAVAGAAGVLILAKKAQEKDLAEKREPEPGKAVQRRKK